MAMSGANFSSTMQALFLSLVGSIGSATPDLTDAVGTGGIDNSLIGGTFATVDTGTVPGSGVGVGTGLTNITDSGVSGLVFTELAAAFGGGGPNLSDLCDAAGGAFAAEVALATLNSIHSPVFSGTGIITGGVIPVAPMAPAIEVEGIANGLLGEKWGDVANAIGGAFTTALLSASGEVTITGSSSGETSGGVGTGTGTVS